MLRLGFPAIGRGQSTALSAPFPQSHRRRSQAHETLGTMTTIIMHTSEGSITINLFDDKAPNTVANFLGLATGEKEWADPYTGQPGHRYRRPWLRVRR